MASTSWKEIASRAADKLEIDSEEMIDYVYNYSALLATNMKKFTKEQYDFFSVAKLTFNRNKCIKHLNSKFVKRKKEENKGEEFQLLEKHLKTKYLRNKNKWK